MTCRVNRWKSLRCRAVTCRVNWWASLRWRAVTCRVNWWTSLRWSAVTCRDQSLLSCLQYLRKVSWISASTYSGQSETLVQGRIEFQNTCLWLNRNRDGLPLHWCRVWHQVRCRLILVTSGFEYVCIQSSVNSIFYVFTLLLLLLICLSTLISTAYLLIGDLQENIALICRLIQNIQY